MKVQCVSRATPEAFSDEVTKLCGEGWVPQYETFRVIGNEDYAYYVILMVRGAIPPGM